MIKITPKPKKMTEIPLNIKITKIHPKPKKLPKYHLNLKNDQNTFETYKMTEIPPKPKRLAKYPEIKKK